MKTLSILSAAFSLYFVQCANAMLRPTRKTCSSSAFPRLQGSMPSRTFKNHAEHLDWNRRYLTALNNNNRTARNQILKELIPYVIIHQRDSFCKAKKILQFTTKIENETELFKNGPVRLASSVSAIGICSIPRNTDLYARIEDIRDLSETTLFPINIDLILLCILREIRFHKHFKAILPENMLLHAARRSATQLDPYILEIDRIVDTIKDPRSGERASLLEINDQIILD